MSQVRQNFHVESEAALNKQLNIELHASYVYLSMAWYFDRDDVMLPGFHKFFKKCSDEEREHAEEIMKYQNMRGGKVILQNVEKPERDAWGSPLEAMQAALEIEKNVNQTLLDMHQVAGKHNDPQMCDWIEDSFLTESVEAIKKISGHVTNLKRVGTGLGEYTFDHEEFC